MTRFDGALGEIAVASRNDFDESVHHGAGVAIDGSRHAVAGVGNADLVVYPRSSLKPMQAHAMVQHGLDLPDELLAVACASHDGSAMHLAAVREILARHGLGEADLANTPARPHGADARAAARVAGIGPSPIQQNCSGKHAAMLATCKVNGWSIDGYLAQDHPLQQTITASFAALGCTVQHIGVDGCGAPTHAISLVDLAGAFSTLASTRSAVAHAMTSNPVMAAGPSRDVTRWMQAVPGLMVKEGAAGVFAAADMDGRAVAYKIADGSDDARRAVVPEGLRAMGANLDSLSDREREELRVAVRGHDEVVGWVRPLEWTPCSS